MANGARLDVILPPTKVHVFLPGRASGFPANCIDSCKPHRSRSQCLAVSIQMAGAHQLRSKTWILPPGYATASKRLAA
jgi:hypothetical protein